MCVFSLIDPDGVDWFAVFIDIVLYVKYGIFSKSKVFYLTILIFYISTNLSRILFFKMARGCETQQVGLWWDGKNEDMWRGGTFFRRLSLSRTGCHLLLDYPVPAGGRNVYGAGGFCL